MLSGTVPCAREAVVTQSRPWKKENHESLFCAPWFPSLDRSLPALKHWQPEVQIPRPPSQSFSFCTSVAGLSCSTIKLRGTFLYYIPSSIYLFVPLTIIIKCLFCLSLCASGCQGNKDKSGKNNVFSMPIVYEMAPYVQFCLISRLKIISLLEIRLICSKSHISGKWWLLSRSPRK